MFENKKFFVYSVGATIGRPLVYQSFYQLTNDFSYRKQISKLWFNHNSGGRPMVAPTYKQPIEFALIKIAGGRLPI